jgi:Tol biopolymer transport system component
VDSAKSPDVQVETPGEWEELRGRLRHRVTEAIDLIAILLQDAVIVLAGFLAEFAYDRWLHSSQPFFQLAISLSSALFLLLYGITVTVHIVNYVRQQFGTTPASVLGQYLPWALAAGGVIAAAVAVTVPSLRQEPGLMVNRTVRLPVASATATSLTVTTLNRDLAISPDGTHVAYLGGPSTQRQVLVRTLDQLEPASISLPGTFGPNGLFFSPDGRWIGFAQSGILRKVPVMGGPVVAICQFSAGFGGAAWGPDGTIIFAVGSGSSGGALWRVSGGGGEPTTLAKNPTASSYSAPEFLPDGRTILVTIRQLGGGGGVGDTDHVAVINLQDGTSKVLIRGGSAAHYVASGHLVYAAAGSLRAVPFDLNRLEVTGTPVPVVAQVLTKQGTGEADFDVARNGTLVYVPGTPTLLERTLVWVDRQGREDPLKAPPRAYQYPRISPDGTRVALDIRDQQNDIWIWSLAGETLTRLTVDPTLDRYPAWSPDGRRVFFTSDRTGLPSIFSQAADGTGSAERITEGQNAYLTSVSPDGRTLIFDENTVTSANVAMVTLDKARHVQPLVATPFDERNGEVSPDGRWLAYQSNESGQSEVYVRPFPDVNAGRWQVSTMGGLKPGWARNSQELFFVTLPGALMSVRVDRSATWSAGMPTKLLDATYYAGNQGRTYDVSPDGKRFLMIKPVPSAPTTAVSNLVVVLNWTDELKRLVPAK